MGLDSHLRGNDERGAGVTGAGCGSDVGGYGSGVVWEWGMMGVWIPTFAGMTWEGAGVWEVRGLGECYNLTMGQSPPGSTYNEHGEGMPFFQGKTDFGFRYPQNRKFCTAPSRIAQPDDTLVSVRAPVGAINMAWEKCCIGRGLAALRHKSGSSSFTYYAVEAVRGEIEQYEDTGTVFGAITKKQFETLPIIEPDHESVDTFNIYVLSLDQRIRANVDESRTLSALRDALLPRLVSGQIRIHHPEVQ